VIYNIKVDILNIQNDSNVQDQLTH